MSFLDEAIYENDRENSIERQLFGGDDDDRDEDDKNPDTAKDGAAEAVEPKKVKRRVSTQPRLNPEKLMGPRGIKAIPDEFKDIKFKGKGYESQDLDLVMSRLAHWAHRLYPKYNFDDCIQAIEVQGKKKVLGHYMRNFRQGLLDDDIVRNSDDDDDNAHENAEAQLPPEMEIDEMDRMLTEEISKTTSFHTNRTFDELGVRELDSTFDSVVMQAPKASSTLTEEQLQRIEENKRIAMEKLKARKSLMEQQQQEKETLTEEQMQKIEENKKRAMERLKQRKLAQNPPPTLEPVSEVVEMDTVTTESTSNKDLVVDEDEEMEPLVYDSD